MIEYTIKDIEDAIRGYAIVEMRSAKWKTYEEKLISIINESNVSEENKKSVLESLRYVSGCYSQEDLDDCFLNSVSDFLLTLPNGKELQAEFINEAAAEYGKRFDDEYDPEYDSEPVSEWVIKLGKKWSEGK